MHRTDEVWPGIFPLCLIVVWFVTGSPGTALLACGLLLFLVLLSDIFPL